MRHNVLVFSDLDGTLLDSVSYSFAPALPALEMLSVQGIALVLCSSKTRAEMMVYRQRLSNSHPFIVENGGGIYIPQGYFKTLTGGELTQDGYDLIALGTPHAQIRCKFVALRQQLGARVRGFTDMDVAEVAALTGLDLNEAALARQRDFDEPFVFDGKPDAAFLASIKEAGLNWTQGRIFHVMGAHDKGRAVRLLKALYKLERGITLSMGLGDSLNDLPMLQAVDYPVLVKREDGQPDAGLQVKGWVTTRSAGPQGWNEAVLELMSHGETLAP